MQRAHDVEVTSTCRIQFNAMTIRHHDAAGWFITHGRG